MLSTKLKEAAGNSADATLYVDDVFSTYLYTGNNTSQTITNGIDLAGKGGMTWIKARNDGTSSNVINDTNRGANNFLQTNSTVGNVNLTTLLTSFNSNGFSVGIDLSNSGINYASWTFREAAKFFDVVTYTGNGVAGRQIAHSLGTTVGMIIVKTLNTPDQWRCYHRALGATKQIFLNLTNAASNSGLNAWNNTEPTSTDFTVGTDCNSNGATYVAYLFAHDTSSTGIIQCGSFTTDGSGNATVNLGWEPQYVLFKRSSGVDDWYLNDTMRGMSETTFAVLKPNLADSENAGTASAYVPTSTGFKITGGSGYASSTYIYMAIRRPNKPPTSGTQVYNAVSYTGNGTANRAITSNFVVDLAIGMQRTPANGSDRFFVDRLRGATKGLVSWDTFAEATDANSLTSFASMTGVVVGTDTTDRGFNGNGRSLNPYFFKRAPGFFDVVCYKGTGSATTQAHNLTVVPELMIVKERSAANDWWVYMSSVGNTKYSVLDSTAIPATSATAWNNTTPTASVFSIGTGANVNASTQTFVAYLFATLAGISKVGSYTGNGTGQAIACGFSAGARFVLIKRTDSTGGWYTFDSARGLTSGSSPYLLLNSTAAETTGNNGVYASTGGFTLGATAITTTNIATATYIFLAVA